MKMEHIFELLKILLPSVVVFLTALYIFKFYLKHELEKQASQVRENLQKETLLLRLQAYERLLLLMERINPQSMIMRLNKNNETALSFHIQLLSTVRAEFEHNIAQQLYVSNEAWNLIIAAKEEVLKDLNLAKEKIKDEDSAIFLIKMILNEHIRTEGAVYSAIDFLKKEAQSLF